MTGTAKPGPRKVPGEKSPQLGLLRYTKITLQTTNISTLLGLLQSLRQREERRSVENCTELSAQFPLIILFHRGAYTLYLFLVLNQAL